MSTRELARFVTGLHYSDLAEPVAHKAKEIILHSLGVQLAASTLPWSKLVYRHERDQGGPLAVRSSTTGCARR